MAELDLMGRALAKVQRRMVRALEIVAEKNNIGAGNEQMSTGELERRLKGASGEMIMRFTDAGMVDDAMLARIMEHKRGTDPTRQG